MTATKVIFRADGNSHVGLGHLYRLFSLVEVVKGELSFEYVTRSSSATSIIPEDYPLKTIPETIEYKDEPNWLANHYEPTEHVVIADGYHFNPAYQKSIRDVGFKLVYIDDFAKDYMYANAVINHSPAAKKESFRGEPDTKYYLGTKHALLRPKFLEAAKEDKRIMNVNTVFVCFGGADPHDLTSKAVDSLLKFSQITSIEVVVGAGFIHKRIYEMQKKHCDRINIHENLSESDLVAVMQKSNMAIAPASTILYELSCVKMPILSGYYVDNQKMIYTGFKNHGAIYGCGNMEDFTTDNFYLEIDKIIKKEDFNDQLVKQQRLFDKDIKERHLNLIKQLC